MVTKWLELLRQVRVAFALDPEDIFGAQYLRALAAPASSLGIQLISVSIGDAIEFELAIEAFAPAKPREGPCSLDFALKQKH